MLHCDYTTLIYSRATLQAKSSTASNPSRKEGGNKKKWESVFAGDIFLRFKHHPNPNTDKNSEGPQCMLESIMLCILCSRDLTFFVCVSGEAEAQVDPLAEEVKYCNNVHRF